MRNNAGIRFHRPAGLMRPVVVGLAVAALALAGGCSRPPAGQGAASPAGSTRAPDSTSEYLPGLEADVYLPDRDKEGDVPVVLLVPGGGWQTADRTGLAPLAASLADAGFVAVNATYRAGGDGVVLPGPRAGRRVRLGFRRGGRAFGGVDAGPVVALGHSAGGHLASLAALGGAGLEGSAPTLRPGSPG